ncbi:beta-ketoacyl [acyl carrier protein] synthase domain-containing protein, partial [Nocardia elegans]
MTGSANAVAIVGMSCRMPGAADLDSYRQMLGDGRAAVIGAPTGPENITERADFLGTAAEFDADFFGIAPDEAQAIDSRHLSALELGWEALENAGVVANALEGLRCGVFVSGTEDHGIAERLSAHFGFAGPSVTVGDAHASSLMAVRLAYASVRSGDSELALAGGSWERGEGGGMVVLKPLTRALADGDRIHAVLREGAAGDESRASSVPGIASLIEAALRLSGAESGADPDCTAPDRRNRFADNMFRDDADGKEWTVAEFRVAGVSSFDPGRQDLRPIVAPPAAVPWVVSARSESGVRAQAARL